jgi:hypothetical protein
VSLVLLLGAVVAACGGATVESDVVAGSGDTATKTYSLSGFTAVHADQGFSVVVKQGESFSVSASVDENLVQDLRVEVRGDALYIGLDPAKTYQAPSLTAEVTMPELSGAEVTAAADMFVEGFSAAGDLSFSVADAGRLNIDGIKAKDATLDVSGGGKLGGKLRLTGALTMTAAGASQAIVAGTARTVDLKAADASEVSLKSLAAQTATVELTGASRASVRASKTVNASLGGGSALDYYGTAELGEMNVVGASQIQHFE